MSAVDVAVVGAGPGGAAAAISICKAAPSLNVRVYERSTTLERAGSVIGIFRNGLSALGAIDPEVQRTVERIILPDAPSVYHTSKGEELRRTESMKSAYGGGHIPWFELQKGLLDLLPAGTVQLGCDLQGLTVTDSGGVVLQFRDQDPVHAKVVIGCDGNQSKIRSMLFDDGRPSFVNRAAWRGITTLPDDWPYTDQGASWFGSDFTAGTVYCTMLRGGLMAWQVFTPWPADRLAELGDGRYIGGVTGKGTPEERLQRCLSTRVLSDPDLLPCVLDLVRSTDLAAITEHGIFFREPEACQVWGRGPVTLLGDAAHLSTPFLAQGLNQALEDALELGRAIGSLGPTEAALREYEQVRVPRATAVQAGSVAIGKSVMGLEKKAVMTEREWHVQNPWCIAYQHEPLVPQAALSEKEPAVPQAALSEKEPAVSEAVLSEPEPAVAQPVTE